MAPKPPFPTSSSDNCWLINRRVSCSLARLQATPSTQRSKLIASQRQLRPDSKRRSKLRQGKAIACTQVPSITSLVAPTPMLPYMLPVDGLSRQRFQPNRKRRSSSVRRPRASMSRPTVPSNTSCFFSCRRGDVKRHNGKAGTQQQGTRMFSAWRCWPGVHGRVLPSPLTCHHPAWPSGHTCQA